MRISKSLRAAAGCTCWSSKAGRGPKSTPESKGTRQAAKGKAMISHSLRTSGLTLSKGDCEKSDDAKHQHGSTSWPPQLCSWRNSSAFSPPFRCREPASNCYFLACGSSLRVLPATVVEDATEWVSVCPQWDRSHGCHCRREILAGGFATISPLNGAQPWPASEVPCLPASQVPTELLRLPRLVRRMHRLCSRRLRNGMGPCDRQQG